MLKGNVGGGSSGGEGGGQDGVQGGVELRDITTTELTAPC
jgi:hypothetical protein